MVMPKSYCFIAQLLTLEKWYSQTRYAQILNFIKMDRAIKCDSGMYVGHLVLRNGSFTFLSAKMRGSQWLQSFCSLLSRLSALLSTEILLGLTCASCKLRECWQKAVSISGLIMLHYKLLWRRSATAPRLLSSRLPLLFTWPLSLTPAAMEQLLAP